MRAVEIKVSPNLKRNICTKVKREGFPQMEQLVKRSRRMHIKQNLKPPNDTMW